ncbi:MAG TPA: SGNH/GDSL hydrolase family protein [Jatrophihabitans sp.]|nr:SGNH/GDSL hydrolase family protein [Jatrophihabitans sp.]
MARILKNTLLAALVTVVAGAAVYVLTDDGGRTSSTGAPVRPAPAGSTPASGSAPASPSAPPAPVVAYLGDDWTSGRGASSPAKRFTTLLAKKLKVQERNFGEPGTGYAKSSGQHGPYRSRIDAIAAVHPEAVVVSGGRNDVRGDPAAAVTQARKLFPRLRARLPHATLIAVTPFWGDSNPPVALVAIAQAVKQGVTAAGGVYLDVPDPIRGHPKYMRTAADPNDRGYAAIAAALLKKLKPN